MILEVNDAESHGVEQLYASHWGLMSLTKEFDQVQDE
jgi:hypothetical protein